MLQNTELFIHNFCNQGFHLIDNFLLPKHYLSLCSIIKELYEHGLFRNAKIGLNTNAHHNDAIRTDEILWLENHDNAPTIQTFLKQIHELGQLLNQNLFLGLHELETHFARYQPGTYYKKHSDQFTTQKTRKVSFVYYLNPNWHTEYGGELKLYNLNDELIQCVWPQGNRLICFNSELPHEVSMTHQVRYSITGWMKTRPLEVI